MTPVKTIKLAVGTVIGLMLPVAVFTQSIGIQGNVGSGTGKVASPFSVKNGLITGCTSVDTSRLTGTGTVVSNLCVTDQQSLLYFNPATRTSRRVASNINRLNRDVARVWAPPGSSWSGTLCLRCPGSPQDGNPNPFPPEGRVWRVEGNVTLKDVVFQGRGTIIVNGTLVIDGANRYADSASSVGFIVRGTNGLNGDIIFTPGSSSAQQVVGAYMATGQVRLNDQPSPSCIPFDLSGSLVANSFDLSGRRPC